MSFRSTKDIIEHDFGEASGLGVLLAGVIGADRHRSFLKIERDRMAKRRQWQRIFPLEFFSCREVRLKCNTSQQYHDSNFSKLLQFIEKIWLAVPEFRRQGLVVRRCAVDGRRHITVHQTQAIAGMDRLWLIRKAKSMKRTIKPVTGPVAGEDSAGPVAAMRCRCKSNHHQPRVQFAKTGDRPAPVFPIAETPDFVFGDLFTIAHKPFAPSTIQYFCLCCRRGHKRDLPYHRAC